MESRFYDGPLRRYQPTIDVTQDPGCGKKLKTKQERIAHNRKLAELYFVNFQQSAKTQRNYDWWYWGCWADNATTLAGALNPTADPKSRAERYKAIGKTAEEVRGKPGELTGEQRAFHDAFEYYAPVEGSLAVVAFEEGAYFRMMYDGKARDDGKNYPCWETILILVNDEGRITHYDLWNDTLMWEQINVKTFGVPLSQIGGSDGYSANMAKRVQKDSGKAQ